MKIREATFTLVGTAGSRMMFGKPIASPKRDDETHDQHEQRTWRERAGINSEGLVVIDAAMVKRSLEFAGRWLKLKLTGSSTFTKRFVSGLQPSAPYYLVHNGKGKPVTRDDLTEMALYVPSDGKQGGTKRVWRSFPVLDNWSLSGSMTVLDEAITESIFQRHMIASGLFDGLGSMRVGRGGPNGRFEIESLEFSDVTI